ncbi:MAG TPA: TerB N-terminal domain-containing protein [Opitutaceae bacterium]|nr:TerB N-terminal domain-containing protein [Opitutaceae bacterium]
MLLILGCANEDSNPKRGDNSAVPIARHEASLQSPNGTKPTPEGASNESRIWAPTISAPLVSASVVAASGAPPAKVVAASPDKPSAIATAPVAPKPSAAVTNQTVPVATEEQPLAAVPTPTAVNQGLDQAAGQSEPQAGSSPLLKDIDVICFLLLVSLLVAAFRYSLSECKRARRKMGNLVKRFEEVLLGQNTIVIEARTANADAAREYADEVRRTYLAAVSLDEVRKLAPGVRLQPLQAAGITRLVDCHGWNAARFQQLRGIGPDSAYRINAACEILTKTVNQRPIRWPSMSNGSAAANQLYVSLYILKEVQSLLHGQKAALETVLEALRTKRNSIDSRTSFSRWIFASKSKGEIKEAIDEVSSVEGQMSSEHELGRTFSDGTARLAGARSLVQHPVSHDVLIADVGKNDEYYRNCFRNLLGVGENEDVNPPEAQPRVIPVPASRPVSVRASTGDVGYSIDRTAGLTIEIKIGRDFTPSGTKGPPQRASDCWVPRNQEKVIAGHAIRGGLIYVGTNLRAVDQPMVEPALIDPSRAIQDSVADCHVRMLDYWSNYTYATPAARASYLQWLERGRNDPLADIGYVFLYFYGLERRAIADAANDPSSRTEIPVILEEVRRLQSIYSTNSSFKRYSTDFLEYLESTVAIEAGYTEVEIPPVLERYRLSFGLRRRLGLFAVAGHPLPAAWAYAWFYNDPRTRLPAAATRCPDQMATLFRAEYGQRFGQGLILPASKTKLKLTYRPSSGSFRVPLAKAVDLPDVTVLSTSYTKIEAAAIECFQQLDGYSRFIARNKDQGNSLDALVLLPPILWPDKIKLAIDGLRQNAQRCAHVLKFSDFLLYFPSGSTVTKTKYIALCRALDAVRIGLEPDIRFGGALPAPDDPVAVYPSEVMEKPTDGFGGAALLLQLASMVASADGDFSEPEAQQLREEIQNNSRLIPAEKQRLLARMATYRVKAASLVGLKKTIEAIDVATRSGLVDFLVSMVYADGMVAPGEVKAMEKIYSLFGMETASLYTRLHALAAAPESATRTPVYNKTGAIQLDKAKVEQLKTASAEITKRLTVIFDSGEADETMVAPKIEASPEPTDMPAMPTLLGLDVAHAGLLTVLLGRPQWTRAEFEELCSDKGLMPDGAIEYINESAFSKFDQAIIEGEDPLEIASHLLQENAA